MQPEALLFVQTLKKPDVKGGATNGVLIVDPLVYLASCLLDYSTLGCKRRIGFFPVFDWFG